VFALIRSRIHQGYQAVRNVRKAAVAEKFRGLPVIADAACEDCTACIDICPTHAIDSRLLRINMGKCIFCGDCERECEKGNIRFSTFHKISATQYERLTVDAACNEKDFQKKAIEVNRKISKYFGHALTLRSVSAGGCNGCELELNACSNVNFDMGRFGITIAASPRHADGIVITGPVTENMSMALEDAYRGTPDPKVIVLAGTCAISGGVFAGSPAVNREFIEKHKIDLFIPGCPFHPLTFINGILDWMGRS
jgi:Ni,Fe-hydrogenase III small subunit/Fe-S-cluster-containing hydrogenase component 2